MPVSYGKGLVGVDTARRTTFKEFPLGTQERMEGNRVAVYGTAASAVTTGACALTIATGAIATGTGWTADGAFAAGEYGWVYKTDVT